MMFHSDGTNIYLTVDGISYGWVTPAQNTYLIVDELVHGYSTDTNIPSGIWYDWRIWTGSDIGTTEAARYHSNDMTVKPDHWYKMKGSTNTTIIDEGTKVRAVNGIVSGMSNVYIQIEETGSNENSITGDYIPQEDVSKEIWRRILNNLPYLLKTKGTERSIKALLSCYGIPTSLLTVREYGGPDPRDYEEIGKSQLIYLKILFIH